MPSLQTGESELPGVAVDRGTLFWTLGRDAFALSTHRIEPIGAGDPVLRRPWVRSLA